MLPSEEESQDVPISLSHYEYDRVLTYSDVNNLTIDAFTIEDPGLIDISSEDLGNDIQQERITVPSGDAQLLKEDIALGKEVMDSEKQFKFKNRKADSSDTNKKKNVDFKNNTGLIGMKIFQRDVIVDDVPDINQNATNKSTKKKVSDPSSDKVVPERDIYERIIGKAYDIIKTNDKLRCADTANRLSNNSNSSLKNTSNLSTNDTSEASFKTCHNPLEEVRVNKMIDNKRPKKVCRSKSLCIPSVQKTIEAEKNVLSTCKSRNITKEVNIKGLNDNYLHDSKITTEAFTPNLNIKTRSRDKNNSTIMIQDKCTPIITQAAEGVDAKISGQCGSVNFKPNIHNRKNVNINIHEHVSNEGSEIIKPTDKKIVTKSIDDQVVNQVAPKVAASISKNRRNTISSAGQITKSTNSEMVSKVKRNFNVNMTKLNLSDIITKPANSDKARNMKIKNDNLNCNNQFKILKDATINKLINNEKAIELTKDKINTNSKRHITTSSVDANNKPDHSKRPIEIKRKTINIIDDQLLTSFVPKVAASVPNKRRNTVSSICPESTSLKFCSRSFGFIVDDKIIPHYHTCLLGNQTGNKDKDDKTDEETKATSVKLIKDKFPLEVNPETLIERNENNENPCKDTSSLSQSKPSVPVVMNINNIVIEPTEPNINFSVNALPTVLPKPCPKLDSTINEHVSNTLNKDIDIPDKLNTEKNTEQLVRTFDSVPSETIPVLLNMVHYPNERNCNNFSSTFPIQSIVSNRPLQEFQTNICLSPRTFHTVSPRSSRIRPWWAPYSSNHTQFNSVRSNQYPIFNRLMNAGTFVRHSYSSRMLTPPLKFRHSPYPILPSYRPNSPCSPTNVLNISPKDTQVVNIKDWKEAISYKTKTPGNVSPAVEITGSGKEINSSVKNIKISEAKTTDSLPVKRSLTENINISNNKKELARTEQSKEKDCNEAKKPPEKEYSPSIKPILSFPRIFGILETSGYDYPNLKKVSYSRTDWIHIDAFDRSDLDETKRKRNDDGTPEKKGKISISEYKKRFTATTTRENDKT